MIGERDIDPRFSLNDFSLLRVSEDMENVLSSLHGAIEKRWQVKISPNTPPISLFNINFSFSKDSPSSLDFRYKGELVVKPGKHDKIPVLSRAQVIFSVESAPGSENGDVIWTYNSSPNNPEYSTSTGIVLPIGSTYMNSLVFVKMHDGIVKIVGEDNKLVDSGLAARARNVHTQAVDICSFVVKRYNSIS